LLPEQCATFPHLSGSSSVTNVEAGSSSSRRLLRHIQLMSAAAAAVEAMTVLEGEVQSS
jgi:hypothetical protein